MKAQFYIETHSGYRYINNSEEEVSCEFGILEPLLFNSYENADQYAEGLIASGHDYGKVTIEEYYE